MDSYKTNYNEVTDLEMMKLMETHHLLWVSSTIRNSIACIAGSSTSIFRMDLEPD